MKQRDIIVLYDDAKTANPKEWAFLEAFYAKSFHKAWFAVATNSSPCLMDRIFFDSIIVRNSVYANISKAWKEYLDSCGTYKVLLVDSTDETSNESVFNKVYNYDLENDFISDIDKLIDLNAPHTEVRVVSSPIFSTTYDAQTVMPAFRGGITVDPKYMPSSFPHSKIQPSLTHFALRKPTMDLPVMLEAFVEEFVTQRMMYLTSVNKTVAIFPAGLHTRWLTGLLKDKILPQKIIIFDDNIENEASINGYSCFPSGSIGKSNFDIAILSSDCPSQGLEKRVNELFEDKLEKLYPANLPSGPYCEK